MHFAPKWIVVLRQEKGRNAQILSTQSYLDKGITYQGQLLYLLQIVLQSFTGYFAFWNFIKMCIRENSHCVMNSLAIWYIKKTFEWYLNTHFKDFIQERKIEPFFFILNFYTPTTRWRFNLSELVDSAENHNWLYCGVVL